MVLYFQRNIMMDRDYECTHKYLMFEAEANVLRLCAMQHSVNSRNQAEMLIDQLSSSTSPRAELSSPGYYVLTSLDDKFQEGWRRGQVRLTHFWLAATVRNARWLGTDLIR